VVKRIDIQADEVRWDDDQRLIVEGEPFTGEAVTYNWLDEVTSLITYADGIREGVQREWYDGEGLKAERTVHNGRIVGLAREWHPNGRLANEKRFDERGLLAEESRWDEDGRPVDGR
jgi:antitoxin component YwqK of YwqJK toxin-antitoxin module